MNVQTDSTFIYKVVVIGDTNCGKTNIITRYCRNEFDEVSRPTIGVEFFQRDLKVMNNRKTFDGIRLQIWDTAGQERFRGMASSYYRKGSGVLLVFDLANLATFKNLEKWINEVASYCESAVDIILVGNKRDLVDQREIQAEEAQEFARKHHIAYFETSAKDNGDQNVEQVFSELAHRIHQREKGAEATDGGSMREGVERRNTQALELGKPARKARGSCCA
jgi:small GTP-binding protein